MLVRHQHCYSGKSHVSRVVAVYTLEYVDEQSQGFLGGKERSGEALTRKGFDQVVPYASKYVHVRSTY